MKMRILLWGLALVPVLASAKGADRAVTLYTGGDIITLAGDTPETAEALAVQDGRIIAVGPLAQVARAAGRKAVRIDLKGRTLLPGFIDAHGHVSSVGQTAGLAQLAPPPVGKADSIAALQAALRAYTPPPGMPIVMGNGYDDSATRRGMIWTRRLRTDRCWWSMPAAIWLRPTRRCSNCWASPQTAPTRLAG